MGLLGASSGRYKVLSICVVVVISAVPAWLFGRPSGDARLVPLSELPANAAITQSVSTSPAQSLLGIKIDQHVRAAMNAQEIPGAAVAVVTNGKLVYAKGYGTANRQQKIDVSADTLFNLASVSKPITAIAVLQLAEQGRLNLTVPVQTYVPTFPAKQWPVSCAALLTHQSGIRHYKGREALSTVAYSDFLSPLDIFKNDPLMHQPGTSLLYSSYGYNLLGAAVQGAAGISYLDYVKQSIFVPAGMTNVRVYDGTVDIPIQAVGYIKRPEGLMPAPQFNATNKIPSGGFLASAKDMGRFAEALMTGKLLSEKTIKAMIKAQRLANGKPTRFGFGWKVGYWGTTAVASHDGGQPGFSTLLYIAPEKKFGVVLLTNVSGAKLTNLIYLVRDEVMAHMPHSPGG